MRRLSVWVLLILLSACGPSPAPEPAPIPVAPVRPTVRVLAGDSLVINGQHIRLADAVTPQPPPASRCWAEALAAKQTRLWVKALAEEARIIEVTPTGGHDGAGRTLAKVSFDGVDLGEQLFTQGAAANPKGAAFRWCEPISSERDGAPSVLSLLTPLG